MSRRLVVGLGNPLAGDDRFGPAVLQRLQEEGLPRHVDAIPSCTDLLDHIDRFLGYDAVVLVDALAGASAPPGTVEPVDEPTLLAWRAPSTSAHRLSPVEALRVFRALVPKAATRITLVAVSRTMPTTQSLTFRAHMGWCCSQRSIARAIRLLPNSQT